MDVSGYGGGGDYDSFGGNDSYDDSYDNFGGMGQNFSQDNSVSRQFFVFFTMDNIEICYFVVHKLNSIKNL
jgi:hypothetical protein